MAGNLNLLAGWIGVLGGVVSGAIIGMFFHREDWVGGYGSFPRRLLRLGHISFFGIGFLNFALALTGSVAPPPGAHVLLETMAIRAHQGQEPAGPGDE